MTVLYTILFFVSTIFLFGVVHVLLRERLLQYQDLDLREDLSEIFTIYQRKGVAGLRTLVAAEIREEGPENYFFRLMDPAGRLILQEGSSRFSRLPWPEGYPSEPRFFLFRLPDGLRVRGVLFRVGPYRAEMAVPLRFNRHLLREVHRAFLWAGGLALFLSIPLGFWLSRRSLRQITEMEKVTREIMENRDFSRRIPLSGRKDEADRLAQTLNRMLETLEIYLRELRQIFDNLAHDFKNLLAHLRLLAERALERTGPEREELIVSILYESDRFLHLLNTLLDISEAETGLLKLNRERFPVAELLEEIRQIFELLAGEKGLRFEIHYPPRELYLAGDRARLLRALFNLVDNAFKYTPPGGRVILKTEKEEEWIKITVEDTGPGLSPEERSRIFERFYTGKRGARGRGLGLALVKAYIEAHGGEVKAISKPGHGTAFEIRLPGGEK
ncbi:sensor histidine kinase KdpD [Thermosulfurimonas sp. F29]|uniref:sensor histidine kinase n=1 Tax=Thermosulfurimonas sp. F29 TaxID=2867247 RepID=UPI001C83E2BD|nr:HAMP domain-containing sensor histidine kinase [Thermosulfurimonas sp. F29]MBX6422833.1 HAMP domain-containing histidine kinase [Thermosulfurimonas sp. F29]